MICIEDKKKCCGCTACVSICPRRCINMVPDREGFFYPHVEIHNCIGCELCQKVCPILNPPTIVNIPSARIVRNTDKEIVADSTSGGAFSAVAAALIKYKRAVVYGVTYDKNMKVCHKCIDYEENLCFFRGSKFVQSDLSGIFIDIKRKLEKGKTVLFSGTPCQVAGLKKYIENRDINTEQLYCIDVVCRGVSSPKLWQIYVTYMENKFHSKMIKAKFRNKTYGYKSSTMLVGFANGKIYKKSGRVDPMMKLFTREMCSRPSCADCAFKGKARVSDLTLFDCKKYLKVTGKEDDDEGYTSVLVQSSKGIKMLELAKNTITEQNVDIEELIKYCGVMVDGKAQPNERRDEFFGELGIVPLNKLVQKVAPISINDRMIEEAKKFLYSIGLIAVARKMKKHEDIKIK